MEETTGKEPGDGATPSNAKVSERNSSTNCDKHVLLDGDQKTEILSTPARGDADVKERTVDEVFVEDEDEFVLRLQSSDEEAFEDAIDELSELRGSAATKSDKYFSDIESSDDSQVYEPKSNPVEKISEPEEGEVEAAVEPPENTTCKPLHKKEEKAKEIELELEPVESDEEYFDDTLLEEGSTEKANLSDARTPSEVEDISNDSESFKLSATPLIDEEDRASNESVIKVVFEDIETEEPRVSSPIKESEGDDKHDIVEHEGEDEPIESQEESRKHVEEVEENPKEDEEVSENNSIGSKSALEERNDKNESFTSTTVASKKDEDLTEAPEAECTTVESSTSPVSPEDNNKIIMTAKDCIGSPAHDSERIDTSEEESYSKTSEVNMQSPEKNKPSNETVTLAGEPRSPENSDESLKECNRNSPEEEESTVECNISNKTAEGSAENEESQATMEDDDEIARTTGAEVELQKSEESLIISNEDETLSKTEETAKLEVKLEDSSADEKPLENPTKSSEENSEDSFREDEKSETPETPLKLPVNSDIDAVDLIDDEEPQGIANKSSDESEQTSLNLEEKSDKTVEDLESQKPSKSLDQEHISTEGSEITNEFEKSLETCEGTLQIDQTPKEITDDATADETSPRERKKSVEVVEETPKSQEISKISNECDESVETTDESSIVEKSEAEHQMKDDTSPEKDVESQLATEEPSQQLVTEVVKCLEPSDVPEEQPKSPEDATKFLISLHESKEDLENKTDDQTNKNENLEVSPEPDDKSIQSSENSDEKTRDTDDKSLQKSEKSLDVEEKSEEKAKDSAEQETTLPAVESQENVQISPEDDKSHNDPEKSLDVGGSKESKIDVCENMNANEESKQCEETPVVAAETVGESKNSLKRSRSPESTEKSPTKLKKYDESNLTETTEIANESVEKSVDSTTIATGDKPKQEVVAEIITEEAKKIEDGRKSIDELNSKAEAVTKEPMETKQIEPEIIEIDDDDDEDEKEKNATTAVETTSTEDKAKEFPTEVPVEVIKNDHGPSKGCAETTKEKLAETTKNQIEEEKKDPKEPLLETITVQKPVVTATTEKVEPTEEASKKVSPPNLEAIETITNQDENVKVKEQSTVKNDTTMLSAQNDLVRDRPSEDDEFLLMIDTGHKEENETEDVDMDTETEQTAQSTDSSSDGSLLTFYDKECVNYECKHASENFYRATIFTLNYYKISRKRTKSQFACEECFDRALEAYKEMCQTLKQGVPLLHGETCKGQEYVEIIDSSDEDETSVPTDKIVDESSLHTESVEMLEAELDGVIRKVMQSVGIQDQLQWTKQILQNRVDGLEGDFDYVTDQLRMLQKKADKMHNSLYQCQKIKLRQLTPLDLNSGRSYNPETESTIPPMGEVVRPSIQVNETYYAVKNKAISSWVTCKVIEAIDNYVSHSKNVKHYKIKFLKAKYPMVKTVSAKHMALYNPPKVRLPIGTRVIAYFDANSVSRAFYPGIIAEPLKQSNKFRYLVFYDDGYFQYVYHKDVRLVCQASENVWEDVHPQSREYIHNYLTQYAVNRPMVQTQKGQSMLVDYNGKWVYARVIDVDCSLVQMLFEGQSRSEWIYRGSTRLGPVYKESNNLMQKNQSNTSRISRRTEPFIRYINGDDSSASSQQPQESQPQQPKPGEVRSVAKKSVSRPDTTQSSQPTPTVRHLNNSTIFVEDDNRPKGKVVYYTARKNLPPRAYIPHKCDPSCPFTITHNLSLYSPLAKPLLSGWERQVFRQKSKKFIVYRGPCGKRMRSMDELHKYLRVTDNKLNVDNFDFSPDTNCLAEYVIEKCIVQKKDISNGKEKMPIPCVNYYDNTMPPDCIYSSQRIPTEGVPLNLDSEFLAGCDCEGDCSDKDKCSCWQLTYAGAKYGMPNVPNELVGYQYKRLYEHVPTGIYECNSRCKCKANCVNRVVQQPLQSKLQVFKTSNRGWGLRCINDVPRGSFICVYAGHLLTEQMANEGGLDAGDEYFAELDYIEVAEQIKEGYESEVGEQEEDEDLYNPEREDEDDDEFVSHAETSSNQSLVTRLRARRSTKNSTDVDDSQERQVISFEPNKTIGQPDTSTSEKKTIRKLFGKDEACYVMDAKVTGNLGRYFNHSCSPNLFVQNVLVDTHDLRFPWVAFFASHQIRAGTELTWNYNYEVGVVPGKVLYCQCGAANCRQRLL